MWQIWLAISTAILAVCFIYALCVICIYKNLKRIETRLVEKGISLQILKEEVAIGKSPLRELYDEIEVYNWNVESFNRAIKRFPIKFIASKYGIESKERFLKM